MKTTKFLSHLIGLTTLLISSISHSSGLIHVKPSHISSDYAKTQYPIVMAHGFALGFSRIGTEKFGLDQFYQITPDLARNGADVFVAQMSPVESTIVRGEQLLQQVDQALAISGAPKVNLIGHSHGGPTIRYIEAVAPDKVASLTSIAGSIKGSPLGDTFVNNRILSITGKALMGHLLAPAIAILEGNPNLSINYDQAMYDLSVKGAMEFNQKFPSAAIPKDCQSDGVTRTSNGVYHYSWIGSAKVTNVLDIVDTPIVTAGTLLMPNEKNHDGLIPICSAKYGKVIRDNYKLNHFDEVNQILGLKSVFAPDPISIFRQHANRLKIQGL